MNQDGSLGFMLQGVSQQPERVQPEGHVKLQRNLMPDPNKGLSSRPGTNETGVFSAVPAGGSSLTVVLRGDKYLISTSTGALSVYGYDGVEWTVNDPNSLIGYIGNNCSAYATNGEIYIVNRDTVVKTLTPTFAGIYDWGYAYALGGMFSRTYKIVMTYSDADVAIGTYTTPDGDAAGDAEATSASSIIAALIASLTGHAKYKGTSTATVYQAYASIRDSAFAFTLTAEDGDNNVILRAGVSAANTFADVPHFGIHDAVIRVTGNVGTFADDVWLKFISDDATPTTGGGFGRAGVWRETANPEALLEFDLTTMPHRLVPDYDTATCTLLAGEWEGRTTGDDTSSEVPSFVGESISDIGEFQARLWFLAAGNFVATRTNDRSNFWRKTAVNVLSSDPVDLSTAGEDGSNLVWGVPYDTNLVIFSSDGQFFIDGGTSFTPANASIVRTTKFEMSSKAKPVVAGATVMFPYKSRMFSGVNEMQPSSELANNSVESLNKVTPRYIRGEITGMASAGNAKILLVQTNDPASANTLWVYNFLWDNRQKIQSAWHEWTFPEPIQHMHVSEGVIYLWTRSSQGLRLSELRPDRPADRVGYHASADFKTEQDTTVPVILYRDDYTFVAITEDGDYAEGREVTPASVTPVGSHFVYTFDAGAPSTVLAGIVFNTELIPNKPVAKDWRGNKSVSARLIVSKYVVDYTESGEILASMDNVYRSNTRIFVLSNGVFPLEDSPTDNFGTTISTGSFDVPWGEDAGISSLVLQSNSVQPVTYVEVRWYAQMYKGKN